MTVKAALVGLVAGTAGVAAMTLGEKLEQAVTHRPDSYTPAHTLQGLVHRTASDSLGMNWAMHWGQGILLGAARGLMAEAGARGPFGHLLYLNLRLLNDQTLEHITGVSQPPWTWPADEQVIDILGKGIYALVTGLVADALIPGPEGTPEPMKPWNER